MLYARNPVDVSACRCKSARHVRCIMSCLCDIIAHLIEVALLGRYPILFRQHLNSNRYLRTKKAEVHSLRTASDLHRHHRHQTDRVRSKSFQFLCSASSESAIRINLGPVRFWSDGVCCTCFADLPARQQHPEPEC